ncbi:hypothetical protein D3C78_1512590 [compost metagenome]
MWPEDHILLLLSRRNSYLAAIACQHNTLAVGKLSLTLFLNHHNGVAVIFTDFEFNTLRFVH